MSLSERAGVHPDRLDTDLTMAADVLISAGAPDAKLATVNNASNAGRGLRIGHWHWAGARLERRCERLRQRCFAGKTKPRIVFNIYSGSTSVSPEAIRGRFARALTLTGECRPA